MSPHTVRVAAGELRVPLSRAQLLALVDDADAVAHLEAYFTQRTSTGAPAWTGARFEALAGGGDRPETADRLHGDDIVAVTLLSVSVPRDVVLPLLEGDLGKQIALLLARVPRQAAITDSDAAAHLGEGQALWQAWDLLNAQRGIKWVTASKLLARKRPALVPVYDRVVRCAFGHPAHPWEWLVVHFADHDADLAGRLAAVREQAGVDAGVSVLRVLDVIVWMRHHPEHLATGCPGVPTSVRGLERS